MNNSIKNISILGDNDEQAVNLKLNRKQNKRKLIIFFCMAYTSNLQN